MAPDIARAYRAAQLRVSLRPACYSRNVVAGFAPLTFETITPALRLAGAGAQSLDCNWFPLMGATSEQFFLFGERDRLVCATEWFTLNLSR